MLLSFPLLDTVLSLREDLDLARIFNSTISVDERQLPPVPFAPSHPLPTPSSGCPERAQPTISRLCLQWGISKDDFGNR